MGNIPARVESALRACLRSHLVVTRAILFGSRARGDADERSDIDLAIEALGATPREWLDVYFSIRDLDTLLAIDVVRRERAPAELRHRITSEGVTFYERDEVAAKPVQPRPSP